MLSNLVLSPSCDIWECVIDDTRSFSVKVLRTHITNTTIALDQNHPRWNKLVPIKVNIASWRIAKGRLPTKINLDLRGIDLHSVHCPLCDDDLETEHHLFIHCRIAKQVWLDVSRWWNLPDPNFSTITQLFSLADTHLTPNQRGCFNAVIHTTLWFLWRARNELVFASKRPDKDLILNDIKHYSHTWISSRSKNCSLNWMEWFYNPCNTLSSTLGEMNLTDSTNMLNPISKKHQINIPTASQTLPPMTLPPGDLVGIRDDYNMICVPLYEASITGDRKSAQIKFDRRPELVRYSITENFETPLHIAVSAKCTKQGEEFVEKLVRLMERDDLELQNGNGETALCIAAVAGNVKMAKMMVKKNEALLTIPDTEGKMPLCKAALFGKHGMIKYLYDSSEKMTSHCWTHDNRNYVLVKCVEANLFDIALQIVEDCPELATNGHVLRILAEKPDVFGSEHYTTMWVITRQSKISIP
ncbi:ankyrin repeat-containing domain, PGG domain protein [Tanacetum coccineum]